METLQYDALPLEPLGQLTLPLVAAPQQLQWSLLSPRQLRQESLLSAPQFLRGAAPARGDFKLLPRPSI